MSLSQIADSLKNLKNVVDTRGEPREEEAKIILIYAFNSAGKTRLSVAYKDATKDKEGNHAGVYYNAFSEDIFVWDNDIENDEENIRLTVKSSSLNQYHSLLKEEDVFKKLERFMPKYIFDFKYSNSPPEITSVSFYASDDRGRSKPIKISRGEERIFVWCFFLALFDIEGFSDKQNSHFFIDDPVSSLDDNNIFITISTLFDLIEEHHDKRKFVITTHHIGFFSILSDWLTKGEKSDQFKKKTRLFILSNKSGVPSLESPRSDVFLYHLHLMQTLETAQVENKLYTFHFALLRQALENIASFLGSGRIGHVLQQIGIVNVDETAKIMNALAHQKVYTYQTETMVPDNERLFREVFGKIKAKYNFVLHAG